MTFSPDVMRGALSRADDRCECTSDLCGDHSDDDGRCQEPINNGQFFAIRVDSARSYTLENCELICPDCFEHRS